MMVGPKINGNPLKISVGLLVISYFLGEFILPKYHLLIFFNFFGILGLIFSIGFFISGFNLFKSYEEDPLPTSKTTRLIKTGIFAYTRNPIYLALTMLHFSMSLIFENVVYFLSSIGLAIWLHNFVIKSEENFLLNKFPDEYAKYMRAVKRWIFL